MTTEPTAELAVNDLGPGPDPWETSHAALATEWVEHLVPRERRELGADLIRQLRAIRAQVLPLLGLCAEQIEWADTARRAAQTGVALAAGDAAAQAVSDGLLAMVGELSGVSELYDVLDDLGYDADDLPEGVES